MSDFDEKLISQFHDLVNEPRKVEACLKHFHEQKQVAEELYAEYQDELKKGEELFISLDENEQKRTTDAYGKFKLEAMQPLMHLHNKLFNNYIKSFKLSEQPDDVAKQFRTIYQELVKNFKDVHQKTPQ